jgi:coenzyme Q-binding protein COQ10
MIPSFAGAFPGPWLAAKAAKSEVDTPDMPRFAERRHLPYSPQQLFDLVADVEKYPDFVPSVAAAKVRRREGSTVWVDMVVGTHLLRKRFASKAALDRPGRIDISSRDALFERYDQHWTFEPAADGGTVIEFRVDFEFRSRLLQMIMGAYLEDSAKAMVSAFRRRARQMYGPGKTAPAKPLQPRS